MAGSAAAVVFEIRARALWLASKNALARSFGRLLAANRRSGVPERVLQETFSGRTPEPGGREPTRLIMWSQPFEDDTLPLFLHAFSEHTGKILSQHGVAMSNAFNHYTDFRPKAGDFRASE